MISFFASPAGIRPILQLALSLHPPVGGESRKGSAHPALTTDIYRTGILRRPTSSFKRKYLLANPHRYCESSHARRHFLSVHIVQAGFDGYHAARLGEDRYEYRVVEHLNMSALCLLFVGLATGGKLQGTLTSHPVGLLPQLSVASHDADFRCGLYQYTTLSSSIIGCFTLLRKAAIYCLDISSMAKWSRPSFQVALPSSV